MQLYSLGSGSSGNGFVLTTSEVAVLIDCGTPARGCASALKELGYADRLAGVIISHEHIDHIRGVDAAMRGRDCPVVTTHGTWGAMRREHAWDRKASGQRFASSSVEVSFVGVAHDAAEPCGFTIDADGVRIAVFTDLGHVTPAIIEALSSADIIVLEANYDQRMLQYGRYPAHLKRRIQGPNGHLSNDDCAAALVASVSSRTQAIWLAHLSHNNNTPAAATSAVNEALQISGREIPVTPLPRYERAEITANPARQMVLGL